MNSWRNALEGLNGVVFRHFGELLRVRGPDGFDAELIAIFWISPAQTSAAGESLSRPQPMLALRRQDIGTHNLIGGRVEAEGRSWPIVRLARVPDPGDDEIRFELGTQQ